MRPIKLVMQAFGPYRDREVVDFAELGPNRVFLVHGDTGAGKTTILDAMVFALYGDTSGGERRADQMRCDSAAADVPTEVMFDFSLGQRSFRIKRRPAQELQGVRGAALVSKQAEVALWERTGFAERQEGKLLATKIRDAQDRITGLLGFSCEQFRQVVVLPQGRFRELLSSGSDKREEILRQLFRTERFRELEAALIERAKSISKQMEALTSRRRDILGFVGAADEAELAALVDGAKLELQSAAGAVRSADTATRQAADALAAAETADEARRAASDARAEVDTLERHGGEIAASRARLEAGARADMVQPAADRLAEVGVRLSGADAARASAEEALLQARGAEQAAVEALAAEKERRADRQAASEKVRDLERLAGAIDAWRSAKTQHDDAAGRVSSARVSHEERQRALKAAGETVAALEADLVAGKTAAAQVDAARVRWEMSKQNEERCRRLLDARAAVAEAQRRQEELGAIEAAALSDYQKAQAALAGTEDRWRSGRAAALATALKSGEPCPVCGSTEHPAPAVASAADAADDALAASRSAAVSAREAYDLAREASAASRTDLAARAREQSIREELGAATDLSLADAESAVAACWAELEELAGRADVRFAEAELAGAQPALTEATRAAQEAANTLAAEEKTLVGAEARLNERAAGIPEELRALGALEDALERERAHARALDDAFATAQEQAASAKEDRIACETAAQNEAAAQAKAGEHQRACRDGFLASLKKNRFSDAEEWRRSLVPESERIAVQQELDAYRDALQQAKGRLQQAEKALEAMPGLADLDGLRAAAELADSEREAAADRHAATKSFMDRLTGVLGTLAEIDGSSDEVRRSYETIGALAEVANGQNPSRVSFQRWVLGVYLDEVLVVASRKLYTMSKGRYQLERQREAASHGRASGLDLAVFDEFSGAPRPAVTLSGGESFLAALALALGLAETVQEHSAGIPLETVFVDEGFGALDADSLELAVDALMELQLSGRLVGVISHVPELKQVIPARLEVRGGPVGSSTQFIVP